MSIRTKKHYSKALLDIGMKSGVLDELMADLVRVFEKLNENLDMKKFLSDPHINLSKKKDAMKVVFSDSINEKTYNFINILIKDKKVRYLDKIIKDLGRRQREEGNIAEAVIESVVPIKTEHEDMIKKTLAEKINKQVVIKNIISPELIGGLRINLEDISIDSSVQGKLDRLQLKINSL